MFYNQNVHIFNGVCVNFIVVVKITLCNQRPYIVASSIMHVKYFKVIFSIFYKQQF